MDDIEFSLSALSTHNPYYPHVLFYVPSINRFMTHDWVIVHDISDLIDTWQIQKWKKERKDAIVTTKDGIQTMIFYLNEEEDEDVLEFLNWNESSGIKGDRDYI